MASDTYVHCEKIDFLWMNLMDVLLFYSVTKGSWWKKLIFVWMKLMDVLVFYSVTNRYMFFRIENLNSKKLGQIVNPVINRHEILDIDYFFIRPCGSCHWIGCYYWCES